MAPLLCGKSQSCSEDKCHDEAEVKEGREHWQSLGMNLITQFLPENTCFATSSKGSCGAVEKASSKGSCGGVKKAFCGGVKRAVSLGAAVAMVIAAVVAWDPSKLLRMLADAREFRPDQCENADVDCCRPVPGITEAPSDPENKLLDAVFFSDTGTTPGPETLAWDLQGRGPYAGVVDGRVIRWNQNNGTWETFAYASPYWTAELCSYKSRMGSSILKMEDLCGRPLGLKFHPISGALYIADAYFGLAVVGADGGHAELLSNESDGVAHKFTNDLDIHENGTIYFTVSSTRRPRRECDVVVMEADKTGRLLSYDLHKRSSKLLLQGLRYPNGVAISKDGTFLLVASTSTNRHTTQTGNSCFFLPKLNANTKDNFGVIRFTPTFNITSRTLEGSLLAFDPILTARHLSLRQTTFDNSRVLKYWLRGEKAGSLEEFAYQPGYPDNIRSTETGDFWVALHGRRNNLQVWLCKNSWASRILFPVYQRYKSVQKFVAGQPTAMAIKYNGEGGVIDVLEDRTRTSHTQFLSNAQEKDGILWLSSIYSPVISLYKISKSTSNDTIF